MAALKGVSRITAVAIERIDHLGRRAAARQAHPNVGGAMIVRFQPWIDLAGCQARCRTCGAAEGLYLLVRFAPPAGR